ncbi:MAG TPA: NUDIX domain-containing protein [Candidatus Saccharimonadales bacterium]|nr:NUDIX domain-containing protein [Candidatus Saccharimonadales bacterium]
MKQVAYPPYEAPTLTVDAVVFQVIEERLYVLLVKRGREPFAGRRALPGVYVPRGETTRQAFDRALQAKAGIDSQKLDFVRQLHATDTVARDPRGHAVSITYLGLGRDLSPSASSSTENPQFFAVDNLPRLAFDHADIIAHARDYLKTEAAHTNLPFALLPPSFTLTQLQTAYELLLGQTLDKRNFRKKLTSLDLVKATDDFQKDGAHRPARLYRFTHPTLAATLQTFGS